MIYIYMIYNVKDLYTNKKNIKISHTTKVNHDFCNFNNIKLLKCASTKT